MNLLPEIKNELVIRLRQTKDKHEYVRLCVILAKDEGMSNESIAKVLRISLSSVYQYLVDYENENKTRHASKGGSKSKLNTEQAKELIDHLQKNTYLLAKTICKYVKEKYDIDYSIPGIIGWLHQNGFEYKEPIKIPGKLDPEKQESFIAEYEKLKNELKGDEEIYFMDAVHPEFQSQSVCGWIKKGEVKTLPTTNKQYRMHFIGALSLKTMNVVVQEYKTVDAEAMIEFLKHLESTSKASKIYVICDNGRANKNKAVQAYLQTSIIELRYLPAYSPNLNPIERFWKLMRERSTYNKCYKTYKDFTEAINNFFYKYAPENLDVLNKRINNNFQRIKINNINVAST